MSHNEHSSINSRQTYGFEFNPFVCGALNKIPGSNFTFNITPYLFCLAVHILIVFVGVFI